MNDRSLIRRVVLSGAVLVLALIGLGGRLAFLHLSGHAEVHASVKKTRHIKRELTVRRGNICDRGGSNNLLALDMAVKDVCADPMKIVQENKVVEVASVLAERLDLPTDTVAVKISDPKRRFAYIRRYLPREHADELASLELPGVFLENSLIRFYPQQDMLCHVLGFVNREGVGSAGIEQRLNRYLKGSPGYMESEVNALRQEVYLQRGRHIPALPGADVTLTIDQHIQFAVENAVDEIMAEHSPKGAWAIVEKVKTGEILAMASRPSFNLNKFNKSDENARMNRCIGFVYEPGSTFKAITIAASLNEGTVTRDTVFNCEHGTWYYGGKRLRDFHAYGDLTVADGLKKSSNILAAKVALTLGDKRLHEYLESFGIGRKSGIGLPGEEYGILHPVRRWSKISSTRIAMGHGVAVTSLQVLNALCAIANNGVLMKPYIIERITGEDGTVLSQAHPEALGRPINSRTAATMRHLLYRVTEAGGTGKRARVPDFEVAGKTGTAEKPSNGGYSGTAHVASFVGFLPASNPEIGIIVVVDEPQPLHTGGRVAAPYFSKIAEQTVRYLGTQPSKTKFADRNLSGGRVSLASRY
ncbi:MAG: penicillin-binding protein 2 [Kiritimatiellia bacterium]|jgi:cell division protein FtsI/penicillin-binding protein 2|nr:penicillin-binding protein 2 [Kiritimatiellia bacterium]MDP6847435.1 penicillin-binding protein 2 [Kiritimatiellia bacterium]